MPAPAGTSMIATSPPRPATSKHHRSRYRRRSGWREPDRTPGHSVGPEKRNSISGSVAASVRATRNAAAPGDWTRMRAARDPSGKRPPRQRGKRQSCATRSAHRGRKPTASAFGRAVPFAAGLALSRLQRVALGGRRRLKRDRVRRRVSAEQHRCRSGFFRDARRVLRRWNGGDRRLRNRDAAQQGEREADVRGRQLSHIEDTPGCRRTPEGKPPGTDRSGSDARPSDAHRTDHATAASTPGSAGLARHVRRIPASRAAKSRRCAGIAPYRALRKRPTGRRRVFGGGDRQMIRGAADIADDRAREFIPRCRACATQVIEPAALRKICRTAPRQAADGRASARHQLGTPTWSATTRSSSRSRGEPANRHQEIAHRAARRPSSCERPARRAGVAHRLFAGELGLLRTR